MLNLADTSVYLPGPNACSNDKEWQSRLLEWASLQRQGLTALQVPHTVSAECSPKFAKSLGCH